MVLFSLLFHISFISIEEFLLLYRLISFIQKWFVMNFVHRTKEEKSNLCYITSEQLLEYSKNFHGYYQGTNSCKQLLEYSKNVHGYYQGTNSCKQLLEYSQNVHGYYQGTNSCKQLLEYSKNFHGYYQGTNSS